MDYLDYTWSEDYTWLKGCAWQRYAGFIRTFRARESKNRRSVKINYSMKGRIYHVVPCRSSVSIVSLPLLWHGVDIDGLAF